MVQLWEEDTDGSKLKNHYVRSGLARDRRASPGSIRGIAAVLTKKIMLRRNYVVAEMDDTSKELVWTFRVEACGLFSLFTSLSSLGQAGRGQDQALRNPRACAALRRRGRQVALALWVQHVQALLDSVGPRDCTTRYATTPSSLSRLRSGLGRLKDAASGRAWRIAAS